MQEVSECVENAFKELFNVFFLHAFRSRRPTRRPARRILTRPTAPSAGEWRG